MGIARQGIVTFVTLAAFVMNVAANLVLIPRFGIVGAAAGSLFSYSAGTVLDAALASRLAGTSVWSFLIPRRQDFGLVLGIVVGLVRSARDRFLDRKRHLRR
jgi:O-antigen/teichoic acid export membrane protein